MICVYYHSPSQSIAASPDLGPDVEPSWANLTSAFRNVGEAEREHVLHPQIEVAEVLCRLDRRRSTWYFGFQSVIVCRLDRRRSTWYFGCESVTQYKADAIHGMIYMV